MVTNDKEIRQKLNEQLIQSYGNDPDTLIVHELSVCQGEARIDIALINGAMHGYEIKSHRDTLKRLNKQIEVYNRIFDAITIVIGDTHYDEVVRTVPHWWGIKTVESTRSGQTVIVDVREAEQNPFVDAFSLAQFLWRSELMELLDLYGADKETKKMPRFKIWAYVAENIPIEDLKSFVRNCLKKRENWPPASQRMLSDGS